MGTEAGIAAWKDCSEVASSEGCRFIDTGGCERYWCFVRVVLRQNLGLLGLVVLVCSRRLLTFARKRVPGIYRVAFQCGFFDDELNSMTATVSLNSGGDERHTSENAL